MQFVACSVKESYRSGKEVRKIGFAQITDAVSGIQVFVDATGIPAEEFLLFMPGKGTLSCKSMLKDRMALLPETNKDILGQCACLAKGDEIGCAFTLQMRKHTA